MAGNGRPTYCQEMVDRVTSLFKDGKSITAVAVALGVHRDTYYAWKEEYPEFKHAAEMGEQLSEAYHETKLHETADGKIDKANGACRIFIMKSRFRETYAEPKDHLALTQTLIEKLLGDK